MIDDEVFSTGITLLCNHYDRQLQPQVIRIWKEYLDEALTTEYFQQAVKLILLESRFFPTAKEIAEVVLGKRESIALEEWEKCRIAASRADYSIGDRLSPQGKFALRAVGGCSRLAQADEGEHKWMRKDFVAAWMGWTKPLGALPEGDARMLVGYSPQQHAQKKASAHNVEDDNEVESVPPPPHIAERMRELFGKMSANLNGKNQHD